MQVQFDCEFPQRSGDFDYELLYHSTFTSTLVNVKIYLVFTFITIPFHFCTPI